MLGGVILVLLFIALCLEVSIFQLKDLTSTPHPDKLVARIRMARIRAGLTPEPD